METNIYIYEFILFKHSNLENLYDMPIFMDIRQFDVWS